MAILYGGPGRGVVGAREKTRIPEGDRARKKNKNKKKQKKKTMKKKNKRKTVRSVTLAR